MINTLGKSFADLKPCVQSLARPLHDISILLKLCWPLHPPLKQQIKQLLSAFLHIRRLAELHVVHETEHHAWLLQDRMCGQACGHACVYHAARQISRKQQLVAVRKQWMG